MAPAAAKPTLLHSQDAAGAIFRARFLTATMTLLIAVVTLAGEARAQTVPELHLGQAYSNQRDTFLVSASWYVDAPAWTRASATELSLGAIDDGRRSRPFVSAGPVWRLQGDRRRGFVELGLSTTLVSGSTFAGSDLGGNLQFKSSLAIGRTFGRREGLRVTLRVQHLSNGGLRSANPGLDTIGLSFANYRP